MALSDTMRQALEPYFDLDFLDPLSAPRKKKDGNYYTTYIAELQPSQTTLVPDSGSVILKEISPAQADIYEKISSIWNPYIETVFGVIYQNGQNLAVNEFIPKPLPLLILISFWTKGAFPWRTISANTAVCPKKRL